MRVFVSSTSKDLADHRAAVRDAILKLGMHPIMMEHFPAMDANALDACQRKVLDCDLFVGIYAHRYGYIPADQGKSITELEYEWAVAANLPRRIFVVKPDYEWPRESSDMGDDYTKLVAFKQRVGAERVWSEFTTPDSLAAAVTQSLVHDAERLSREQKNQRRMFLTSGGVFALLLVGIIAAIVIFANPDEIAEADRAATNQAIAYANDTKTATQWTSTPTATNTATPTPTFTPSNTPTPIPTALEGPVAQEGETLLLIADFTYIDADATRVEANLENEFEDATVRFVRIHHPIEDRAQAKAILAQYNATIILWGSVARGGVRVEFEISQNLDDQATISLLSSGQLEVAASDVRSFDGYIFEALDTRYIVETMLGRLAYYEGDYQAALAAFGRAKQRVPADRAADVRAEYLYMFQGRAYEAEGEFDAALTAYNDALTMDSTWGMPYYFISFIYAKQKNFTQAYTASDEAIRLGFDGHGMFADDTTFFESSAYLLRGLSNLLMASTISGVPTSAVIADLDRALELLDGLGDPSLVADAYVARGVAHLFAGDVVSAVTDFDTALVLDPNRAYLHAQQASALMVTDDNDGALQSINRAIELDTTTASYYQLRGDILVQLGQFEAALAAYDRALEIAPSDYLSFAGRGTVYTQLGDYAAAIDAYNQALTLAPQVTSLYMQRGSVYFEMEDYANAAADYTTALESDSIEMATALADPKLRSGGYALRGQAYLQLGQYNACRDDLTVSIEAVPDANVYALRARCAMFMNDGSSAEADFNAAFELNPNQANIFSGRVYLYTQVPGYENCTLADAAYLVYVELIGPSEPFSSWVTTTCNRATPSPTPPTVTDALFPDGTIITLPGPRPVSLLTEPLTGNPSIFCTPSTEATVLQTVQLANGTRWVQLECDGGIGWMDESKLPIP